jgi:hypothetical protein
LESWTKRARCDKFYWSMEQKQKEEKKRIIIERTQRGGNRMSVILLE